MTDLDSTLAASPLPPLHGADATAERLVLLVHRGVDWQVWGGARRARYWDALTERVRAATYAGPTLNHWWTRITADITSEARSPEDRLAAATALSSGHDRAVLNSLHRNAAALVLRVRVLSETARADREGQDR